MRNRGVCQHPLDVCLGDGNEVTNGHGQHCEDPDHHGPFGLQVIQAEEQDAEKCRKCRGLGPGTHESGDRSRCALVYVGRPHVERYNSNLEEEAGTEQNHAGNRHRVAKRSLVRRQVHADIGDIGGAGHAVKQSHTIKQESG